MNIIIDGRVTRAIYSWIPALFLFAISHEVPAAEPTELLTRYQEQRLLFVDGRELISRGNIEAAAERIGNLDGYPLQSYYEYLLLRRRIQQSESPVQLLSALASFDQRYSDARSYRRLLGVLKNRVAALNQWSDYHKVAAIPEAPVHPCDDLYARVQSADLTRFDRNAAVLWQAPAKHTEQCKKAFDLLIDRAGDVPTASLWKRTVALLQRNDVESVQALLPYYGTRDRRIIQSWIDNLDKPESLLKMESVNGNMIHHQALARHTLDRWLSEDLTAANSFWKANGAAFGFNPQELGTVTARHAVLAAKRLLPEAPALLADANSTIRQVRYWRVRAALRQGNWEEILTQLDRLTEVERASTRWQYWRARALEGLGREDKASSLYASLAGRFEYYGFLAADRIAATYHISDNTPEVDDSQMALLAADKDIARAIEFFLVDVGWEGRRVWNNRLDGAGGATLVAAAEIASVLQWFDRSYATIRMSDSDVAFSYQFPTPYIELITSLTHKRDVFPSLVYAVIRRESAYIPDVKSPAGALGLMQLMPATAKEMASRGVLDSNRWSLIDAEVNMRLGVEYLDSLLRRYDKNVAYTAAAYNAGPSRVNRWREGDALPIDIWVEVIPFDETRDYVKNVLFSSAVFSSILHGVETRISSMTN